MIRIQLFCTCLTISLYTTSWSATHNEQKSNVETLQNQLTMLKTEIAQSQQELINNLQQNISVLNQTVMAYRERDAAYGNNVALGYSAFIGHASKWIAPAFIVIECFLLFNRYTKKRSGKKETVKD